MSALSRKLGQLLDTPPYVALNRINYGKEDLG